MRPSASTSTVSPGATTTVAVCVPAIFTSGKRGGRYGMLSGTARIQEVHLVTYHAICGALEQRLFGQ